MKKRAIASLLLLCAPQLVHAQAYRCKQANGSLAFQDHPCAAGVSGSFIGLPPAQGYAVPDSDRPRPPAPPTGRQGSGAAYQAQLDAYNRQVEARDKASRCALGRNNLGVNREQRPVFHYDNSGNKVYTADKDRPAAIAAAQEMVETNCQ